jgi:hypothetical protein
MSTQIIDGKLSLADQENTLNGMEQALSAKTVNYTGQPGGTQNQATLEDVPLADPLEPLYLQAVDVGGSTAALVAQYQQKGQSLAFQGTAYVSGTAKTVMGFR